MLIRLRPGAWKSPSISIVMICCEPSPADSSIAASISMDPESNAAIATVVESRTSLADKVSWIGSVVGVGIAVGDGVGEATGVGRGVAVGEVGDGAGVVVGALVDVAVGDTGVSIAGRVVGLVAGGSSSHADREATNRHGTAMIGIRRPIARNQTSNAATPYADALVTALTDRH